MSETKSSKKDTTKVEKTKVEKTETKPASEAGSVDKSTDKTSDKSVTAPKSASQTSISHFSSVSTDKYRSGWANIFSGKKTSKTTKSKIPIERD